MEKQIIIGVIGLVGVYVLYRILTSKVQRQHAEAEPYGDILNDEKYKVKGQWDR